MTPRQPMKQVKCWAYVRMDGVVARMASEKPAEPSEIGVGGSRWVEMTGELPDVEQTCEVRWHEHDEWRACFDTTYEVPWIRGLEEMLAWCKRRGYRVTNDPREVVLREESPGAWWLYEGNTEPDADGYLAPDTRRYARAELARDVCRSRGWRILREEPLANPTAPPWLGEVCKRCNQRNVIGFSVSDEIWQKVVRDRWNVLCPACFDIEAQRLGIAYVFDTVHPVSWSSWCETRMHEPAEPPPVVARIPKGQLTPDDLKAQRESWARGESAMGSDADEARERAQYMAEQRPTLQEMLDRWRAGPRDNWDHLHLDSLLARLVKAIGGDKQ